MNRGGAWALALVVGCGGGGDPSGGTADATGTADDDAGPGGPAGPGEGTTMSGGPTGGGGGSSDGSGSETATGTDTNAEPCNGDPIVGAPYPSSPILCGVTWDAEVDRAAQGSDNWAMTWADDGDQYTAYGDGWGFEPMLPDKLSLGLAKVQGDPPNWMGINIPSPSGEQLGDGPSGKKTSGILFIDGALYMLVRNANLSGEECQAARSDDYAQSWTWSTWTIPELGYCAFLNFGQAYAGAIDDFVYAYASDDPSAYETADQVVLARVPRGDIMTRASWEFVSDIAPDGTVSWSSDIAQRTAVFEFPGGCNRLDVTHNPGVDRYLMAMRARGGGGSVDHFSIYDAPQPWGPWTTVFYTENWDVDPGEVAHIPSKWLSADGLTFYLVFAGDDAFSVRRGTFEQP